MNLQIQDTGLGRTDPYVITDNGEVLAQSYPNEHGEHFQAGLREIVDEITTLRAQLAEAVEIIKNMKSINAWSSVEIDYARQLAKEYLNKVTPA